MLEKDGISWNDCMKSEVLHTDKEERNIIHTLKQGKDNWICHIFIGVPYKTCYQRRGKRDGKKRKKK